MGPGLSDLRGARGREGAGSCRSRQSAGQAVSFTNMHRGEGMRVFPQLSSQLLCRFAIFRMKDGEELVPGRPLCLCAAGDGAQSHAVSCAAWLRRPALGPESSLSTKGQRQARMFRASIPSTGTLWHFHDFN